MLAKVESDQAGQGLLAVLQQVSREKGVRGLFASNLTFALNSQDVAKTRIMLAKVGSDQAGQGLLAVLQQVSREKGVQGLFAGNIGYLFPLVVLRVFLNLTIQGVSHVRIPTFKPCCTRFTTGTVYREKTNLLYTSFSYIYCPSAPPPDSVS
jgi:hypothetical protein